MNEDKVKPTHETPIKKREGATLACSALARIMAAEPCRVEPRLFVFLFRRKNLVIPRHKLFMSAPSARRMLLVRRGLASDGRLIFAPANTYVPRHAPPRLVGAAGIRPSAYNSPATNKTNTFNLHAFFQSRSARGLSLLIWDDTPNSVHRVIVQVWVGGIRVVKSDKRGNSEKRHFKQVWF